MKKCKIKANCKIPNETILNFVDISGEFFEGEMDSYIHSFNTADHKITIYIKEKYYYRIKSSITVTLIIDQTEEATIIEIVSGGGKQPYALGFGFSSFGAETDALEDVVLSLKQLGFAEVTE